MADDSQRNKGKVEAQKIYDLILKSANYFMHNSKHFSVEVLAAENPTYAEIAKIMTSISKILWALADDFDPMMHQKAHEYCELMTKMGVAIANQDQALLSNLTEELAGKPGI